MQDLAVMAQAQALGKAGLGHARPDDVALAHVPDAFGAVDQVVNLALEDRLEVGLHLAPGHLDPDRQRQRGAGLDLVDVGADDLDLAVVDLVQVDHGDELEGGGLVAAELDVGVLPCGCARLRRPGRRAPGSGTLVILTLQPRTSSALSTIVSCGTLETTCS